MLKSVILITTREPRTLEIDAIEGDGITLTLINKWFEPKFEEHEDAGEWAQYDRLKKRYGCIPANIRDYFFPTKA